MIKQKIISQLNILSATDQPGDLIHNLLIRISNLGLPFFKHRKNSEIYIQSYKRLDKLYSRYREEVFPAFKLAHEFFNNSNFIFRPEKISISDFIKFKPQYLRYNPYAKRFSENYKIVSLFSEFAKGRSYIEGKYLKVNLPKVDPELLETLIDICKQKKIFREEEKIVLVKFLGNAEKFCKLNPKLNIKSIFIILQNHIQFQPDFQIHFLNSRLFWENILPKKIVQIGLYSDQNKLKKLGEFW